MEDLRPYQEALYISNLLGFWKSRQRVLVVQVEPERVLVRFFADRNKSEDRWVPREQIEAVTPGV